jgi:hypothetical protein
LGGIEEVVKLPNHNPIEDLGDEVIDNVNWYRMTHLSLPIFKCTEFGIIKNEIVEVCSVLFYLVAKVIRNHQIGLF